MKRDYEDFCAFGRRENKANSKPNKANRRPSAGNPKHEALNPNELKECDLKKQSQFLKGQNDAMPVMTMVYGDFDGPRRQKNKANSKPIPAESAGKLVKLDVNENIGIPLRAI